MRPIHWRLATILAAVCVSSSLADYRAWIGWDDLVARVGAESVPTGADVIVGQVEAADSNGYYMPDAANPEFEGKYLIRRSGGATAPSSHATMVAKRFYGVDASIAPGIWFINCYETGNWVQGGYLHVGAGAGTPPNGPMGAQKIWNNSWIGSFGNTTLDHDALRRVDWVIERDDVVFTVGLNNGNEGQPLMAYGYNTISVGRRDGEHAAGDVPDPYDGAGRMMPDITGPLYTTSEATPVVSAAVALLVEMARSDDALPSDAEQPEVLKAILMAAATHEGVDGNDWTNQAPQSGPERGLTMRPLDEVVGAGHLQVDHAHQIMSGGQTLPAATLGEAPAATQHGWSFDTVESGGSQWWRFNFSEGADTCSMTATWNRAVPSNFGPGSIADFDLELFLVVDGQAVPMIGDELSFGSGNIASASEVDNVEHLWIRSLEVGSYALRATRMDGGAEPAPLAVAWWTNGEVGGVFGDLNGDGLIGIDDLLIMLSQWGDCDGCTGDLDDDGLVGVDDLLLLLSLF